jgi:DNA-binding NarL/FixJ family response regulator
MNEDLLNRGTKGIKALIVEDNPLVRETLRELLRGHFSSMTVEEASNGKEY